MSMPAGSRDLSCAHACNTRAQRGGSDPGVEPHPHKVGPTWDEHQAAEPHPCPQTPTTPPPQVAGRVYISAHGPRQCGQGAQLRGPQPMPTSGVRRRRRGRDLRKHQKDCATKATTAYLCKSLGMGGGARVIQSASWGPPLHRAMSEDPAVGSTWDGWGGRAAGADAARSGTACGHGVRARQSRRKRQGRQ